MKASALFFVLGSLPAAGCYDTAPSAIPLSRVVVHPASCMNSKTFHNAAVITKVPDGSHRIIVAPHPVRNFQRRECQSDKLLVVYIPADDFATICVGDVVDLHGRLSEEKSAGSDWSYIIIADQASTVAGEDQECRAFVALSHAAENLLAAK